MPKLIYAQTTEVSKSLPVDLTKLNWFAIKNFNPKLKSECRQQNTSIKIQKFPIILNNIFHVPTGEELLHYTICFKLKISEQTLQLPLAIHLPWIGESWQFFLNGKLIRDEMALDDKGNLARRSIHRKLTIPLKSNLFKKGDNHFVFHLAGYQAPTTIENNTNLGLIFKKGYEIDHLDSLQKKHADYSRVIQISIFLFFGLYHVIFFAYRMRDRYNLFFGLFLICMAGNTIMGHFFTAEIFVDTSMINRLKYMFQSLSAPLIIMFVTEYFALNEKHSRFSIITQKISLGSFIYFSIMGLGFLVLPFQYTEVNLWVFQKSMLPLLLMGFIMMLSFLYKRKDDAYILSLGLLFLILGVAFDALQTGINYNLAPVGTMACIFALVFMLARRFLTINNMSESLNSQLVNQKNSFQRFVPIEFLQLLNKTNLTDIHIGDSNVRHMSVLFTDIRAFTSLSESMGVEDNFKFLNSYLQRMEPNIQENGGFVDKYIGDAILALYPDKKDYPPSAARAIQTAIDFQFEIDRFNKHRAESNYLSISIGTAINTGEVMLGTVGSKDRLDTTVIGNTVNLASRLESLNKLYNSNILISGYTHEALFETDEFLMREIDAVCVVGKTNPVVIHEVFHADPPEIIEKKIKTSQDLLNAIILYKVRDFKDAKKLIKKILKIFPEDRISQIYLERCTQYIKNPPDENWRGILELTHK